MNDLIIEGASGIPDGLYVKKDGELFKYKPNGGTVRTVRSYHVTNRPKGHWITIDEYSACSVCDAEIDWYDLPYCPFCGADMRGERSEDK